MCPNVFSVVITIIIDTAHCVFNIEYAYFFPATAEKLLFVKPTPRVILGIYYVSRLGTGGLSVSLQVHFPWLH